MKKYKPTENQKTRFGPKIWQNKNYSSEEKEYEDKEIQSIKQFIETRGIIGGVKVA